MCIYTVCVCLCVCVFQMLKTIPQDRPREWNITAGIKRDRRDDVLVNRLHREKGQCVNVFERKVCVKCVCSRVCVYVCLCCK